MAKVTRTIIIGATAGPGKLLYDHLQGREQTIVGVGRRQVPGDNKLISLDATDTDAIRNLVAPDDVIIHCSRPELLTGLLAAGITASRIVAIGSTRIYTNFPDDKCRRVTAMTTAIANSGIPFTVLHPTMIYGAPGLNNVERIVAIARISPVIPLPSGGESLIQPIHAEDLVAAICACLDNPKTIGATLVVPGGGAITYREFVNLTVTAAGLRCRAISLATPLISAMAVLTRIVPFVPGITQEEVLRLTEDKAFDLIELTQMLGISPREFSVGIHDYLGSAHDI